MAKQQVPWSVKGVSPDARRMAKEHAQARGITIGEWVTEAIDHAAMPPALRDALVTVDAGDAPDENPAAQRAKELVQPLEEVLEVMMDRLAKLERRTGG